MLHDIVKIKPCACEIEGLWVSVGERIWSLPTACELLLALYAVPAPMSPLNNLHLQTLGHSGDGLF